MSILKDRRGVVAAMSAVMMVGVIGFAGLAIDLTRIWMVNARLKTAIDAASLVAARQISEPQPTRDALVENVFWANYTQNGRWGNDYLRAAASRPAITQLDSERIQVSGAAVVPTTLFSIIDRRTTTVSDSAIARRQGTGLEIAIVLDQTSSMRAGAPGFSSKLAAAQNAVGTLLGILYGSDDVRRNLWVSVVPFSRTVNIGTGNAAFLDVAGMPTGWSQANWSGCVEARTNGNDDITDLGPGDAGGLLRPYFYQSTYRRVGYVIRRNGNALTASELADLTAPATITRNITDWNTATQVPASANYAGYTVPQGVGIGACTTANAYPAISVNMFPTSSATSRTAYTIAFCRGENDYTNPNGLSTNTGNAPAFNPEFRDLVNAGFTGIGTLPTSAAGPNRLCAQSPILPLTASRATVQNAVNAITAPVRSGGTTIVAGMQGAWYTLSPRWQNRWPAIATNSTVGTLPLNYNTRNMNKAVIILTDGDNNWQGFYTGTQVRGSPTGTELLYNAYGRVAEWNATFPADQISPVTQANGDARLDGRFSAICAAMKGPDPNNPLMRIYVIGFEVASNAHRTMLQQCATSPAAPYYLEAPSAAALQSAFTIVANSLASLRLLE